MEQTKMIDTAEEQRKFITQVYMWMALALFTTAIVAFVTASSTSLAEVFLGNRALFYGLLISEFIVVLILSGAINKMSASVATVMFFIYAILNGLTFSSLFLAYTYSSIASVFVVTGGTFGVMCAYGYLTKRDLSSVGNICLMALIGLIIASIVNIFINNNIFYFVISVIGIIIFVALTAYDTQKIKRMASSISYDDSYEATEIQAKGSIIGALSLYLDFINLFLYILRIFGRRR